jgi:hypothetical protein
MGVESAMADICGIADMGVVSKTAGIRSIVDIGVALERAKATHSVAIASATYTAPPLKPRATILPQVRLAW